LYLENEFGIQKGLLSYNRVVRQRQGGGEYHFEYEDVIPEQSWDYKPEEIPAHRTIFYERNGHPVEHIYNSLGNLIVKRERILNDCSVRELVSRYRYNKDGMLLAALSPEGTVVQYYYGREDFYRQPVQPGNGQLEPWRDPNLTQAERSKFGNLLGLVKRGGYYDLSKMNLARGLYGDFFSSIFATNSEDVIVKTTYEPDYQQITSVSDPRYTQSVDPRHPEGANLVGPYSRHLTVFDYSSLPRKNLVRVKYPDTTFPSPLSNGSTGLTVIDDTSLQYDARGRLEKMEDPEGNVTENRYFPGGGPAAIKQGYLQEVARDVNNFNLVTTFDVSDVGIATSVLNPRGVKTNFVINELNQTIETISGGPGYRIRALYDKNGLLKRQERDNLDDVDRPSPDGDEVKTYKYDEQNNLVRETRGGNDLTKHHVTRYRYDSSDKRVETILPRGNNIRIKYDERLLLKATIRGASSAMASTTRILYDGDGRKIAVIDGRGNISRFAYDSFNRVVSTTDALGNVQQSEYDKLGNITATRFFVRKAGGTYHLLARSEFMYDERGSRIREINYLFLLPIPTADIKQFPDVEFLAAQNQGLITPVETQFFYDKNKRLFRVVNAKGQEATYEYDGMNRRIIERDSAGNYVQTFYDENSNVVRVDRHELVRDPLAGTVIREDVFSTINEYDDLDRRIATMDGLGNRTTFTYDSRNNVASVTDALGNVIRYQYDIFNRKTREIVEMTETGLGGGTRLADIVTQFAYDENGNLTQITDAGNAETQSAFDPLDRLASTTFADTSYTQLEYDADDHVIARADNNGLKILFDFDALGRRQGVRLDKTGLHGPAYPVGAEEFEEYKYDGFGRVLRHKNDFCEINVKYDSLGRSYEERVHFTTPFAPPAVNLLLSRTFDALANRTGIIYPSGREIQYSYDALNRLDKIENISKGTDYPGSATFSTRYDIAKYEYRGLRLAKATYGNQTEYALAYDGLGRIISTKHESGGVLLLEMRQLYDGAGNRRFQLDDPAIAIRPGGEAYTYDSLYRLTKFERKPLAAINPSHYEPPNAPLPLAAMTGQQTINTAIGSMAQIPLDYTYKYDALGNRQEEKQAGQPSVPYVVNLLNQYETKDAVHFRYDLNGNLVDDGTLRYLYNYRNLLVSVQNKATNADLLRLSYDATGRLIAFREGASAIHLVNDGLNVIEERDGGNLISQYVYENGIDRRCQLATSGNESWYHRDLIQSTRLLSNSSGQVLTGARYEYDPFGSIVTVPAQYNPYLFAGKRLHKSINLYYSRARQYSPALGRFLQRDPKGTVDGLNLYTYTGNNPVTYIDLLGLEKNDVWGGERDHLGRAPYSAWLTSDFWARVSEGIDYHLFTDIPKRQEEWDQAAPQLQREWKNTTNTETMYLTQERYVERRIGSRPNRLGVAWDIAKAYIPMLLIPSPPAHTPFRLYHTTNADVAAIQAGGRIVVRVEGSAYAADTLYAGKEGALSTGLLAQGKHTIIYQGEAAAAFRPHPIEGLFSLVKRLGGQYKSGFGDLELVESNLIDSNTLLVTQLKLVEPFQEPFVGLSRLWGRRALEVAIPAAGVYGGKKIAEKVAK